MALPMSDVFFTEPSEAPVPPEEVRVRQLGAAPRRDGARIDVKFDLTPFQRRPNIDVVINDPAGREVTALSIVEAIDHLMEFTMHLREPSRGGLYTLELSIFYADVEAHNVEDHLPHNGDQPSAGTILERAKHVVAQRKITFEVPLQAGN